MRAKRLSTAGALVLLATTCLTTPQVASALEPGVHVDPGSPAAKEYALPLNQARRTGAQSTGSSSSETPFGAGIKPPDSGGSNGGGATHGSGAARGAPRSGQGTGAAGAQLPPAVQRAVDAQRSSGGGGSLPVLIGGGVAILVLGAFGGTVLRRSRRPLLGDDHAR
ncbi:MAG TPA: hypothetical protein VK605_05820 [Solirubrobacteraceae bacterium]|nr:hypothetical protein [Solirubrobacteraceae bacterium]